MFTGGKMSQEEFKSPDLGWPSQLVLIRHAESERNRVKKNNRFLPNDESANIVRGVPDYLIPLTARGHAQAAAIGPSVRERFGIFDTVYDSTYIRTRQTRDGVLNAYKTDEVAQMKIRSNHWLRERFPGYAYDMTDVEVDSHFPWLQKHFDDFGMFYATPVGGESLETLCRTIHNFIGILRRVRAGKRVCIFSHGGTIRAFRYNLEKWEPQDFMDRYGTEQPENCGVTVYDYSKATGRLVLTEFNRVYWEEDKLTAAS
jgi:2,3-bisphosphoglycerate-dependent phosphoglycerate mutase